MALFEKTVLDMLSDYSPSEAIESVWYYLNRFIGAKDELEKAQALVDLHSAVGDLISWHPRYNEDTGEIDEEED